MPGWFNRSGRWFLAVGGITYGLIEAILWFAIDRTAPLSRQVSTSVQQISEGIQILALIALAAGLVWIIAQWPSSHVLVAVGFFLAFAGTLLAVGLLWSGVFLLSYLGTAAPEIVDGFVSEPPPLVTAGLLGSNALFGIGWIVFSIAQLTAERQLRAAWSLIIGGILLLLGFPPLGGLLFAAGIGWIARGLQEAKTL